MEAAEEALEIPELSAPAIMWVQLEMVELLLVLTPVLRVVELKAGHFLQHPPLEAWEPRVRQVLEQEEQVSALLQDRQVYLPSVSE